MISKLAVVGFGLFWGLIGFSLALNLTPPCIPQSTPPVLILDPVPPEEPAPVPEPETVRPMPAGELLVWWKAWENCKGDQCID